MNYEKIYNKIIKLEKKRDALPYNIKNLKRLSRIGDKLMRYSDKIIHRPMDMNAPFAGELLDKLMEVDDYYFPTL